MRHLYIGICLYVLFLLMNVIMYTFKEAVENVNESEIDKEIEENNRRAVRLKKIMDKLYRFSDTLDVVVFGTNMVAGSYILWAVKNAIQKEAGNNNIWIHIGAGFGMLVFMLVFGVIIPKQCGKRNADKTALRFSGAAGFIIAVFTPITVSVSAVAGVFLKLFGLDNNHDEDNVTEEEIITMVNEGQEQGVLEASEAEMITNIFELGDKNAGDIMTHRSSIEALDCFMTLDEVIQSQKDGKYSRFPVYEGDIDNIIGTLHIRDALVLYSNIANRKKNICQLRGLLREAYLVPETRNIDELLREMQDAKVHMGIVVDEYGQTAGIICMEDIIEEIVGNILDEYDEETSIQSCEDDTYIVEGLTRLEELDKLLGVEFISEEFDTLNGFLISKLNRLPYEDEKEEVVDNGYRFKILEVSQNVVRKVEIKKEPEIEETTDGKDRETEE